MIFLNNSKIYFILIFLFLISILSCTDNIDNKVPQNIHFDFIAWNNLTLDITKSKNITFFKTITVDNQSQTLEVNNTQWIKDLAFLSKYNLNKPDIADQYTSRAFSNDTVYLVSYSPIKKSYFKTIKMRVFFSKSNKIKQVMVVDRSNTGVFNVKKDILIMYDTINKSVNSLKIKTKRTFFFIANDSLLIDFQQKKTLD